MKVHHIALTVKNIEASKLFYKELFSFEELKKFRRDDMGATGCFLQGENIIIELWQFDIYKIGILEDLSISGIKHIAFECSDLKFTREFIISHGVKCGLIKTGASGGEYFFLADPDGNNIEIYKELR